jgi:protein-arginine kinase activator protein McsA
MNYLRCESCDSPANLWESFSEVDAETVYDVALCYKCAESSHLTLTLSSERIMGLSETDNCDMTEQLRSLFPNISADGPWPMVCIDCDALLQYKEETGRYSHVDAEVVCFLSETVH